MPARYTSQPQNTDNKDSPPEKGPLLRGTSHKLAPAKASRQRCDCGRLAVTVITVIVGSEPQYSVELPLCAECLRLEKEMQGDS
jgi:hypothetical protein